MLIIKRDLQENNAINKYAIDNLKVAKSVCYQFEFNLKTYGIENEKKAQEEFTKLMEIIGNNFKVYQYNMNEKDYGLHDLFYSSIPNTTYFTLDTNLYLEEEKQQEIINKLKDIVLNYGGMENNLKSNLVCYEKYETIYDNALCEKVVESYFINNKVQETPFIWWRCGAYGLIKNPIKVYYEKDTTINMAFFECRNKYARKNDTFTISIQDLVMTFIENKLI